jgi:hypothetical protein
MPHTLLLESYTPYVHRLPGAAHGSGTLGEFNAFVHSSAGPLPSETMGELAL